MPATETVQVPCPVCAEDLAVTVGVASHRAIPAGAEHPAEPAELEVWLAAPISICPHCGRWVGMRALEAATALVRERLAGMTR